MAPKSWSLLALAAFAVACGGKKAASDDAAADAKMAAMRARNDSVRKARKLADSLEVVRFSTCRDSVSMALGKTKAGRKKLAQPLSPGQVLPEVQAACAPADVVAAPVADAKAPAAKADTSSAAPAMAPAPAARQLTAAQKEVARRDSVRQAKERDKLATGRADAEKALRDSVSQATIDSTRADSLKRLRETEVVRETFAYAGGARDPFRSVVRGKSSGPELVDLTLEGILEDVRAGSRSVAVLRDKRTNKRYTARAGEDIGRNRVVQIRGKDVTFSVVDFGVERRETLTLRKQEDVTP